MLILLEAIKKLNVKDITPENFNHYAWDKDEISNNYKLIKDKAEIEMKLEKIRNKIDVY